VTQIWGVTVDTVGDTKLGCHNSVSW